MILSFWSTTLVVSTIQCLLLLLFLAFSKAQNSTAKSLLVALLSLVLMVNISSLITANYWYRIIPEISGFARGMVLLFGPLIYLYALSITKADFRIRPKHLGHFVPYVLAIAIIRIQLSDTDTEIYLLAVDALMNGEVEMGLLNTLWFVAYSLQLMVYVGLIRFQKSTSQKDEGKLQINLELRKNWINRLSLILTLLAAVFVSISIYCFVTLSYSAQGNFLYTLVLGIGVYIIAYQTILEKETLFPAFKKKYGKNALSNEVKDSLQIRFGELFENEKLYTHPDVSLAMIATKLETNPTQVSRLVNSSFGKSFSEIVHEHRIAEFKRRLNDPKYQNYSIIGIAEDVGYNSKSTFNTAFKKITGTTPTEYLKTNRIK
ncbi:MAG: AraC family transcriptional regulator [Bacteroidota bacterium]